MVSFVGLLTLKTNTEIRTFLNKPIYLYYLEVHTDVQIEWGGLQNGKGRASEVLPLQKGGAEKV